LRNYGLFLTKKKTVLSTLSGIGHNLLIMCQAHSEKSGFSSAVIIAFQRDL